MTTATPQRTRTFCARCGAPPPLARLEPERARTRVCPRCGLGLLLSAPAALAPERADPFLIADASLGIGALSRRAERLLGTREENCAGLPLADVLSGPELAEAVARAASGRGETLDLHARTWSGSQLRVRVVAPCGPPPAALVVLAR